MRCTSVLVRLFQSTLPLRGVTVSRFWSWIACRRFQSTLPLRGATRGRTGARLHRSISIHTPLAGSDFLRNQVSSIDARPGWYHGEGAPHAVEERHRIFVDAYGRSPQGAWIEIYWSLSARSRNARVSGRIQDRTHGLLTRRCHQRSHRPASTPDETSTGPYHTERSNPLRRSFPARPSIPPPPTSTVRDAAAIH